MLGFIDKDDGGGFFLVGLTGRCDTVGDIFVESLGGYNKGAEILIGGKKKI